MHDGPQQMLPAFLATVALMCSFMYGFWCEAFVLEPLNNQTAGQGVKIGPWYAQTTEVLGLAANDGGEPYYVVTDICVTLNGEVDRKTKITRAFTVICMVLGGLNACGLYMAGCAGRVSADKWILMAFQFLILLPLFQGLTFLLLKSDVCNGTKYKYAQPECHWDRGASFNVAAIVLWFLTGLVMMAVAGNSDASSSDRPARRKSNSSHG